MIFLPKKLDDRKMSLLSTLCIYTY